MSNFNFMSIHEGWDNLTQLLHDFLHYPMYFSTWYQLDRSDTFGERYPFYSSKPSRMDYYLFLITSAIPHAYINHTLYDNIQSMMYSDDRNTLTITPVLNLDQVQNGVNNMKGLFNSVSNIGYTPSIAGTNYRMSNRYNDSTRSDLVNAINGLNGTSVNNTYNVNGITYDDGSNVAAAVGSLIRAAKIDRRT